MAGKSRFCGFLLKLLGWTADTMPAPEEKCVILGVPHTSIADFLIAFLYYRSVGGRPCIMIKAEMFKGPVGWFLKKVGCIPVDRSHGATVAKSIITAVEQHEGPFHLCLAPEGTRKAVKRWKAGYHVIAKALDCPVYAGYFDWNTKHVGRGEVFPLTDDAKADTERLQAYYESLHLGARHPELYLTH